MKIHRTLRKMGKLVSIQLLRARNIGTTLLKSKMAHLSPPTNPGISMTRYSERLNDAECEAEPESRATPIWAAVSLNMV